MRVCWSPPCLGSKVIWNKGLPDWLMQYRSKGNVIGGESWHNLIWTNDLDYKSFLRQKHKLLLDLIFKISENSNLKYDNCQNKLIKKIQRNELDQWYRYSSDIKNVEWNRCSPSQEAVLRDIYVSLKVQKTIKASEFYFHLDIYFILYRWNSDMGRLALAGEWQFVTYWRLLYHDWLDDHFQSNRKW